MSPADQLSWLCRLVDESLRRYTGPGALSSTCEHEEKEVLLASSQVVSQIQLRIRGFDSCAEGVVAKPDSDDCPGQHSPLHPCLPRIVAELMVLLTFKSEFVRHVAINALVVTSHFLSALGSIWDGFINLLCSFYEMAIVRLLSNSSEVENCGFDSPAVKFLIQYGLENCDWSTVAGITQVLRVICKSFKEEDYDGESLKVYFNSVNSFLLKVPWDLLDEYWSMDIDGCSQSSSINRLGLDNSGAMVPGIKFLGTFLQLLCSLADWNDLVEPGSDSASKYPLLATVSSLIPRLVKWCLNKQYRTETCIIHYLKHKLLVLMIRLGSQECVNCSTRLSWLELIHNYFQELLQNPLICLQSDQDDCLEGSPFLLSLSDLGSCGKKFSHLQRQVVFLFLDCLGSLICLRGANADDCNCLNLCSCVNKNPDSQLDRYCRQKGSLELYKWVQIHLPTEISIDHGNYIAICIKFMSSFLQLFLHEDDLFFEVLLQLLTITSCLHQPFYTKDAAYQDLKKDFPFDISDIFNPLQLFHLFLSEIHYDHQVLLDYLISTDTGINCAKYLLRCLRLICNSWKLFFEFPFFEEFYNQSYCKRRKLLGDGIDFLADRMPSSVDSNSSITLHTNGTAFKKAAECLITLKTSVDKLYQKDLFPYNPEVLMKRLSRFQELCFQEKGFHR